MNPAATLTTTNAPAKPRRRWWLRGVLVLAFLGVALGGVYLVLTEMARRDWDAAIAETDALDPRWRLEELQADLPDFADADNAALVAMICTPLARKVRLDDQKYETIFAKLPANACLNRQQIDLIRAEFARVPELDKLAAKLKTMPTGRFPMQFTDDYYMTSIDDLQGVRAIGDWLKHEAFLLADLDKADEALQTCQCMLTCGRMAGQDGLVSYFIRTRTQTEAVATLERVLGQGEIVEASLREMQKHLEREARTSSWISAVRNERAGMHHLFDNIRTGKLTQNPLYLGDRSTAIQWIYGNFPRTTLKYYPDQLRFMNQAVEIAKLPIHEQAAKLDDWHAAAGKTTNPIVRQLTPALTKAQRRDCCNQGLLRSATAAMACEIYRKRHGQWPESLEVLVKEKLVDAVPMDPIDNQPLRYRRTKDGIVIYSIGPDGVDNQGHFDPAKWLEPGVDFGFRLWNADRRRQPALPPVTMPGEN